MFAGEHINTTEDRAVQALAAARAARRCGRPRLRGGARHAGRDAGLRRAGARRPHHHRRRQHRHRRLRPRPADGGAGARRASWRRASASTSSPTSTATNWPACCSGCAPEQHAVPDRLQDLHHARDDDQRALGQALVRASRAARDIARHFAALTTNVEAARELRHRRPPSASGTGWAGAIRCGRPSACRSRIAIGAEGFRELLAGAHAMDEHFRTAPLEQNLPVRLGLLDVWYRNFHGFTSRSIAPYHSALRRLPAYLQQLEMESNGKQRRRARAAAAPSAPRRCCGASPAPTASMPTSRCCTRAPTCVPVEFIAVRDAGARRCQATTTCCWPMRWRRRRR